MKCDPLTKAHTTGTKTQAMYCKSGDDVRLDPWHKKSTIEIQEQLEVLSWTLKLTSPIQLDSIPIPFPTSLRISGVSGVSGQWNQFKFPHSPQNGNLFIRFGAPMSLSSIPLGWTSLQSKGLDDAQV